LPYGHPTGPELGEQLPDFTLPNASGVEINYHADRAGRKSVVVFYRSAVW
jgi:peroxiredoxin